MLALRSAASSVRSLTSRVALASRTFASGASHSSEHFNVGDEAPLVKDKFVWVTFVTRQGAKHRVPGLEGESLLQAAQRFGIKLNGSCQGGGPAIEEYGEGPSCFYCHVLVANEWSKKLPARTTEEKELLRQLDNITSNSRLGCQVKLTKDLNNMLVALPLVPPAEFP